MCASGGGVGEEDAAKRSVVVQASSVERRACGAGGDYDVGGDPVRGGERARRTQVVGDMRKGGGGGHVG